MAEGDKFEGDIYVQDGMTVRDELGIVVRVTGTQRTNRDLSTKVSWWDLRPKRDIKPVPEGRKWCSAHDQGDDEGWVDRAHFSDDKRYRDGKYPICNGCKARHERKLYALRRAEQGIEVRSYMHKKQTAGAGNV